MAKWPLIGFFFFGGLAFVLFDETRWIGIGQIWMAVAVLLALFHLGVFQRIWENLRDL